MLADFAYCLRALLLARIKLTVSPCSLVAGVCGRKVTIGMPLTLEMKLALGFIILSVSRVSPRVSAGTPPPIAERLLCLVGDRTVHAEV